MWNTVIKTVKLTLAINQSPWMCKGCVWNENQVHFKRTSRSRISFVIFRWRLVGYLVLINWRNSLLRDIQPNWSLHIWRRSTSIWESRLINVLILHHPVFRPRGFTVTWLCCWNCTTLDILMCNLFRSTTKEGHSHMFTRDQLLVSIHVHTMAAINCPFTANSHSRC